MKHFLIILWLLAAICAEGQPKPVQAMVLPATNYRLSSNDVVHIKVFQEDDLDTLARIAKDGTIQFPLIGSAKIGGSTVEEAVRTLEGMLKEYLLRPEVTIRVTEYSKRHFTVLGQVMKPGTYDFPEDSSLNLLEAIGLAGGYTRIANPTKVILKRQVNGVETIFKLNAKSMAIDGDSERFLVLPGDTILIGESLI